MVMRDETVLFFSYALIHEKLVVIAITQIQFQRDMHVSTSMVNGK